MKRIELNCLTGASVEVEQVAYVVAGSIVVLDATTVAPDGAVLATPEQIAASGALTPYQLEEIKRRLLAEAIPKRDALLLHLRWFYTKAVEERAAAVGETAVTAATVKVVAISAAIESLQTIFTDQRVLDSVDGAVKGAVQAVYLEIFQALHAASLETWLALKALDPL